MRELLLAFIMGSILAATVPFNFRTSLGVLIVLLLAYWAGRSGLLESEKERRDESRV